jgi:hypothetical protein
VDDVWLDERFAVWTDGRSMARAGGRGCAWAWNVIWAVTRSALPSTVSERRVELPS